MQRPKPYKYDTVQVDGGYVLQVYETAKPSEVIAVCHAHDQAQRVVDAFNALASVDEVAREAIMSGEPVYVDEREPEGKPEPADLEKLFKREHRK